MDRARQGLIVHEDLRLIAVDKPVGQPVIPARGLEQGPRPLIEELSRLIGQRLYVVHRIDRDTSGVVLFAKDPETHKSLCRLFETRAVAKSYRAMVLGEMERDLDIDKPLREFGSGRPAGDPQGKPSRTMCRVRERLAGATLLEVEPHTGRRHQIRAHLYAAGHPILGDPLYGKNRPVGGISRLMLHAASLSFKGPEGPLSMNTEPGTDFTEVLRRFRRGLRAR